MKLKLGTGLLFLAGLLLAVILVVRQGVEATSDAVLSLGWGLVGLAVFHLIPMGFSALGWQQLVHGLQRTHFMHFFFARLVREAADNLLPLFVVGGQLIGARILTFYGVPAHLAGATVVVDLTMEALSQCIFTILGLVLLFAGGHQGESTYWILLGLAIVMPGLVIFALLQRQGMFKRFEDWLERIAHQMGWHWLRGVSGLDEAIRVMYQNHGNLAWSFVHHTIGWIVGALEVWITLRLMGIPFSVTESLILESLGQAIRSIGFAVPGALGVQEGGYMLLGTVFGLSHETGLAISLVKRVREIIKGTPALLAWQYIEGHKLVRRYANDRSKPG